MDNNFITGLAQAAKPALETLCRLFSLDTGGTKIVKAERLRDFFNTVPPSAASGLQLGWAFFVFVVHPSISRVVFSFSQSFAQAPSGVWACVSLACFRIGFAC
jgi:hypothetical protein